MAVNDEYFYIPQLGHVFLAPVGTGIPTSLTAPEAPWQEIGHIGGGDKGKPDGLPAFKADGGDQTPLGSWAKATVRSITEALTETVEFSISELNNTALQLYTNNDGGSTAGQFDVMGVKVGQGTEKALLIVFRDGDAAVGFHAQKTSITRSDDIEYGAQDPLLIPVVATLFDVDDTTPRYSWIAPNLGAQS